MTVPWRAVGREVVVITGLVVIAQIVVVAQRTAPELPLSVWVYLGLITARYIGIFEERTR